MKRRSGIGQIFLAIAMIMVITLSIAESSQTIPKRIISLAPSITEEIYLLGAQDNLVGNTAYCVTPPNAKLKEKVGSITQLDIEKAVRLKPDLVLAASLTNPKSVQKLKDLGIEVKIFLAPKDFASLCDQFIELGRALGKQSQAENIVSQFRTEVAAIKAKNDNLIRPKVFIEIGDKPLFTANKDYFINDFVKIAGADNIAEDSLMGTFSREDVVKQNADVILIVTMGMTGTKEKEAWKKFSTLNAVRYDNIYILDSRKVCSPTPVSFVSTLKEIEELLHKKKPAGNT